MKIKPLLASLFILSACPLIHQAARRPHPPLRDSVSDDFQNLRETIKAPRQSPALQGKSLEGERMEAPRGADDSSSGNFSPVIAPSALELVLEFKGVQTIYMDRRSEKALREGVASDLDQLMLDLSKPKIMAQYGIDPRSSENIGALQKGMDVEILSTTKDKHGSFITPFKATARALIHKNAARVWIDKENILVYNRMKAGNLERVISMKPLPLEKGLELEFEIRAKPALSPSGLSRYENQSTQLSAIRGDNGNGEDFEIYAVQGFFEDWFKKRDDGWKIFKSINQFMSQNGFQREIVLDHPSEKRYSFIKEFKTSSGRILRMRFHHLAAETEPGSETFSAFMKEAVNKGDVVLYGGHSGYGINLSLKTLNSTLRDIGNGPIRFPDKKQIYFFDTCYGYKYNSQDYREISRRKNVDVITYGIMSDFVGADAVWKELLSVLLDPGENPSWMALLKRMEKAQNGQTYLLNVGGL